MTSGKAPRQRGKACQTPARKKSQPIPESKVECEQGDENDWYVIFKNDNNDISLQHGPMSKEESFAKMRSTVRECGDDLKKQGLYINVITARCLKRQIYNARRVPKRNVACNPPKKSEFEDL